MMAAALLAALLLPAGAPAAGSRYAIVIGQNLSDSPRVGTLRYADDDAIATHELLVESGVESYLFVSPDAETQRLRPGLRVAGPPRRDVIMEAVARLRQRLLLARQRGEAPELLFFYSGHGDVAHGEGYVVLQDGRLTRTDLAERILATSAAVRNHVLIDACKSYYMVFARGQDTIRTPYTALVDVDASMRLDNTGFVLSTSSDRDSHEWELLQAGVFSHEVRSALRGAADVDLDGQVTYAELGAFLQVANHGIKNPRYRPDYLIRPPGGLEHPILAWAGSPSSLLLDQEVGRMYVESSGGERLLDAHPRRGQQLRLRLPVGQQLYVQRQQPGMEYALAPRPGPQRLSQLTPRRRQLRAKGALSVALSSLFAEPFGSDDVTRFVVESHLRPPVEPEPMLRADLAEVAAAPSRGHDALLWAAGSATVLGLGANGWALERRWRGGDAGRERRLELNGQIKRLNLAAIALYGAALVSAGSWALWEWLGVDEQAPPLPPPARATAGGPEP